MARTSACTVDGCQASVKARGLCNRHYHRQRAHGDVHFDRSPGPRSPLEERFWSKVAVGEPGECWPWQASLHSRHGYGGFAAGAGRRTALLAHRVAWELAKGEPAPHGLLVCHHCDNRLCCNPDHLFLGTVQENNADRDRKGRNVAHSGERNGNARLSESDVVAIRASSHPTSVIAEAFGVSIGQIQRILAGSAWAHLAQEAA